eukprot:665822_1
MATSASASRKRTRDETEEDDTNTDFQEPPTKKMKIDDDNAVETIKQFMVHPINKFNRNKTMNTIHLIKDIIGKGLVTPQFINSYFLIQWDNNNHYNSPTHRTLLQQVVHTITAYNYTKQNETMLFALKQLFVLLLHSGANPMLSQNSSAWNTSHLIYKPNTSLPQSTNNIFHSLRGAFMKDIKYDLYLFSECADLKVSILNIQSRINSFGAFGGAFYFADHIARDSIVDEFTFDVGVKGLCWCDLITVYTARWTAIYEYQHVKEHTIADTQEIIHVLNNALNSLEMGVWMIHLYILKEYYKLYPHEFAQSVNESTGMPMDIVNIVTEYCIPQHDYSWLDDDVEETVLDEHQWILQCLRNV